jgi:hypothetical protein
MQNVLQFIANLRQAGFTITILRVRAKRRTVILSSSLPAAPTVIIAIKYTSVLS